MATPYLLIWSSYWAPFLDWIIDCCVVEGELWHTVLSKTLTGHDFKRNGWNPIKPHMGENKTRYRWKALCPIDCECFKLVHSVGITGIWLKECWKKCFLLMLLIKNTTVPTERRPCCFGGNPLTDEKSPIDSIKHFFNGDHQLNRLCPVFMLVPM